MKLERLEKISGSLVRSTGRLSAQARLSALLELFTREDDVLIVISADPDAMASAMAMKRLLSYRCQRVTIGYPNEIRRLNNLTMIKRLNVPIERLHTLSVKDYSKRILIDSQPTHNPCFEKIQFDVVIDHHPVTGGWDAQFIDIRPDYGAVSTIMIEYLRAAGIKISSTLATALFYGIKVDTHNFEKQSHQGDGIAFRYLFDFANRNLVRKFERSDVRRTELKYFKLALDTVTMRKGRAYAHLGKVSTPDILVIVADFFNHVEQFDWVFVSGVYNDKLVVIIRCDGYRKHAGKLVQRIFGKYGSAGGHREAARAELPLKNLPLRESVEITTNSLIRLASEGSQQKSVPPRPNSTNSKA